MQLNGVRVNAASKPSFEKYDSRRTNFGTSDSDEQRVGATKRVGARRVAIGAGIYVTSRVYGSPADTFYHRRGIAHGRAGWLPHTFKHC